MANGRLRDLLIRGPTTNLVPFSTYLGNAYEKRACTEHRS